MDNNQQQLISGSQGLSDGLDGIFSGATSGGESNSQFFQEQDRPVLMMTSSLSPSSDIVGTTNNLNSINRDTPDNGVDQQMINTQRPNDGAIFDNLQQSINQQQSAAPLSSTTTALTLATTTTTTTTTPTLTATATAIPSFTSNKSEQLTQQQQQQQQMTTVTKPTATASPAGLSLTSTPRGNLVNEGDQQTVSSGQLSDNEAVQITNNNNNNNNQQASTMLQTTTSTPFAQTQQVTGESTSAGFVSQSSIVPTTQNSFLSKFQTETGGTSGSSSSASEINGEFGLTATTLATTAPQQQPAAVAADINFSVAPQSTTTTSTTTTTTAADQQQQQQQQQPQQVKSITDATSDANDNSFREVPVSPSTMSPTFSTPSNTGKEQSLARQTTGKNEGPMSQRNTKKGIKSKQANNTNNNNDRKATKITKSNRQQQTGGTTTNGQQLNNNSQKSNRKSPSKTGRFKTTTSNSMQMNPPSSSSSSPMQQQKQLGNNDKIDWKKSSTSSPSSSSLSSQMNNSDSNSNSKQQSQLSSPKSSDSAGSSTINNSNGSNQQLSPTAILKSSMSGLKQQQSNKSNNKAKTQQQRQDNISSNNIGINSNRVAGNGKNSGSKLRSSSTTKTGSIGPNKKTTGNNNMSQQVSLSESATTTTTTTLAPIITTSTLSAATLDNEMATFADTNPISPGGGSSLTTLSQSAGQESPLSSTPGDGFFESMTLSTATPTAPTTTMTGASPAFVDQQQMDFASEQPSSMRKRDQQQQQQQQQQTNDNNDMAQQLMGSKKRIGSIMSNSQLPKSSFKSAPDVRQSPSSLGNMLRDNAQTKNLINGQQQQQQQQQQFPSTTAKVLNNNNAKDNSKRFPTKSSHNNSNKLSDHRGGSAPPIPTGGRGSSNLVSPVQNSSPNRQQLSSNSARPTMNSKVTESSVDFTTNEVDSLIKSNQQMDTNSGNNIDSSPVNQQQLTNQLTADQIDADFMSGNNGNNINKSNMQRQQLAPSTIEDDSNRRDRQSSISQDIARQRQTNNGQVRMRTANPITTTTTTTSSLMILGDDQQQDNQNHQLMSTNNIDSLRMSIPGEPGQDYPIYGSPPKSSFDCLSQSCPGGYYADLETKCQVFHICQADGRSDTFLCPNGTIFSQQHFVCVWWWQVDCNQSKQFYKLNDDIYCNGQSTSALSLSPSSNEANNFANINDMSNNNIINSQQQPPEVSSTPPLSAQQRQQQPSQQSIMKNSNNSLASIGTGPSNIYSNLDESTGAINQMNRDQLSVNPRNNNKISTITKDLQQRQLDGNSDNNNEIGYPSTAKQEQEQEQIQVRARAA